MKKKEEEKKQKFRLWEHEKSYSEPGPWTREDYSIGLTDTNP